MRPAPDFVVAGFMKGGTSAASKWLTSAGIKASAPEKEPDYFSDDDRYAKGPDWYRTKVGAAEEGLVGDCSTSYLDPAVSEVVAARLHRANPDVRIVISVRDPVDRAISHVRHDTRLGSRHGVGAADVAAAITVDSAYVLRSRYALAVRPYLARFDPGQILVLDVGSTDEERWDALVSHLGRSPMPFPAAAPRRRYATEDLPSYHRLLGRWHASRVRAAVGPLIPRGVKRRAARALVRESLPPTPVAEARALIDGTVLDLLAEELAEFRRLTRDCVTLGGPGTGPDPALVSSDPEAIDEVGP